MFYPCVFLCLFFGEGRGAGESWACVCRAGRRLSLDLLLPQATAPLHNQRGVSAGSLAVLWKVKGSAQCRECLRLYVTRHPWQHRKGFWDASFSLHTAFNCLLPNCLCTLSTLPPPLLLECLLFYIFWFEMEMFLTIIVSCLRPGRKGGI